MEKNKKEQQIEYCNCEKNLYNWLCNWDGSTKKILDLKDELKISRGHWSKLLSESLDIKNIWKSRKINIIKKNACLYMTLSEDSKPNKLSLKHFRVSSESFISDLSQYYSDKKYYLHMEKFKSKKDYIGLLYWCKFVQKFSYAEISELFNIGLDNVYVVYGALGWNYEGSFEENKQRHEEYLDNLHKIKQEALSYDYEKILPLIHPYHQNAIKMNIRHDTYGNIGIGSLEQYVKVLYYLIEEEKLSTKDISFMFNISIGTVQYRLKKLGLLRNFKEAQSLAKRDYTRVFRQGRKTRVKSFLQSGMFGSNNENAARTVLEHILPDYIDVSCFDIIVGLNTRNIIPPDEIDIPIIIVNRNNNKVYKFAVEYNGITFHGDSERENKKKNILAQQNWNYIPLIEMQNPKMQREFALIEEQLEDVCIQINGYIKSAGVKDV